MSDTFTRKSDTETQASPGSQRNRWRDDYTNPESDDYWTDDRGSASALLLLAGLIPLAFVVWFLAHVAGAVATVGGVQ